MRSQIKGQLIEDVVGENNAFLYQIAFYYM